MSSAAPKFICLKGVRHNNLKNFDLDLPLGKLIVITGLSGSGKSSLAFDTLYAEGQRRYVETFSPYARQFFDRMDKPRVDSIQGIPPAIALEQRNAVKSSRSTIGTMTEITDYMKLLWPHLAQLACRGCGRPVRKDSAQSIWREMVERWAGADILVTFVLPLSARLSHEDSLALLAKQGYQRLLWTEAGRRSVVRLDEVAPRLAGDASAAWTVVQDRLKLEPASRARFSDACEQAYHFGKGQLSLFRLEDWAEARFSRDLHCAECGLEYREPTPALFSFNNPVGACPSCKGFGRVLGIDYSRAIPNPSLSIAGGVIKPWQTGTGLESQIDLLRFCKASRIPVDVPFQELPLDQQRWVIDGDPEYGKDPAHEWPRAWYGLKGYFRWLESKTYKIQVRVQLARYRCYTQCGDCAGQRFKPEALQFRAPRPSGGSLSLAGFYQLPVGEAIEFVRTVPRPSTKRTDPFNFALEEVQNRLQYLEDVGLGYLTLDRSTRSLSGGETERVNLTTCLGSRLVNTLFVLDEPSVGLHPRDTERLIQILKRLRDAGNTVIVVEHESLVMRAADQIIDLGPGQGERGGQVVFQGSYPSLLEAEGTLTGAYLSGRQPASSAGQSPDAVRSGAMLRVSDATLHNLQNFAADIPLGGLVVVSGVSGSGKSTLVRELIFPALDALLQSSEGQPREQKNGREDVREETREESPEAPAAEGPVTGRCRLHGWESLGAVKMVDQSPLGRTPRSNPAVYIGAFDHLRALFAESESAVRLRLNESSFSFNSAAGRCEKCAGAGFEKIEMQFLSDVFIRCPECAGRRYRPFVLEATIRSKVRNVPLNWSIASMLEATVEEAIEFLESLPESGPARRAAQSLAMLREVGLGYLRLGQPMNTLSGGESQRLKLVQPLAECAVRGRNLVQPTLFIFDEPTTGLHFHDVEVLLGAFRRLLSAGHSLLVIEHNLEVIRAADWVIDLGPEAGARGGQLVAAGPPEAIARHPSSLTGRFLAARTAG